MKTLHQTSFRTILGALAVAVATAGVLPSQSAFLPPNGAPPRTASPEAPLSVALRTYSVSESRRAFAMCDLNHDDMITYREARRTLASVQSFADFRLFDEDNNGVIYFAQFDARFRMVTRNSGAIVLLGDAAIRRIRPDPMSRLNESELTVARVFRNSDRDGDGRISKTEWTALAASFGSPAEAQRIFEELDRDQSGDLSLGELLPLAGRFWAVQRGPELKPAGNDSEGKPARLPDDLALVDTDGDQFISERELRYSLLRINPRLERFADEILEAADLSGDRRISAREAARIGSQD